MTPSVHEYSLDAPAWTELLSAEEIATVRQRVFALRARWHQPDPSRSGYVLGTAAYMGFSDYHARTQATNAMLQEHFGWLYDRLTAALDRILRAVHDGPLTIGGRFGLPGFQIILTDESGADARGNFGGPHWDWNLFHIAWQPPLPEELDLSTVASFTLALALPAAGGGLQLWPDLTSVDVTAYAAEHGLGQSAAARALVATAQPEFHPYAAGGLIVHSGHVVHEVAPWTPRPGDERITLQGHALFHDGQWQIYW